MSTKTWSEMSEEERRESLYSAHFTYTFEMDHSHLEDDTDSEDEPEKGGTANERS